ncbi:MAG: DUF4870 domain-containing protein [Bacteroidales bacterium]|nr:DUF4870 domain-containing protein [Bacteroidales bacterium]
MQQINYINNEERTMSMLCHLSALGMFLIPFGAILGPLIVWLVKKDQYLEVDKQGKDAINFQITMKIFFIISGVLVIIGVGLLLMAALVIFNLVIIIVASIKSNSAERFVYPAAIKFIQ